MDAQQAQKEKEENTERETTKREWEKRSGGVDRLYDTFEGVDEHDDEAETTPAAKPKPKTRSRTRSISRDEVRTETPALARVDSTIKPRGKDIDKAMTESPSELWRRAEGSKLEGERERGREGERERGRERERE